MTSGIGSAAGPASAGAGRSSRGLRLLVTGLVVCLLVTAGLVYPRTVPHAAHHAHHNATTHASVLCAWLCAAGQGVEAGDTVLFAALTGWKLPKLLQPGPVAVDLCSLPGSRAPPRGV